MLKFLFKKLNRQRCLKCKSSKLSRITVKGGEMRTLPPNSKTIVNNTKFYYISENFKIFIKDCIEYKCKKCNFTWYISPED